MYYEPYYTCAMDCRHSCRVRAGVTPASARGETRVVGSGPGVGGLWTEVRSTEGRYTVRLPLRQHEGIAIQGRRRRLARSICLRPKAKCDPPGRREQGRGESAAVLSTADRQGGRAIWRASRPDRKEADMKTLREVTASLPKKEQDRINARAKELIAE